MSLDEDDLVRYDRSLRELAQRLAGGEAADDAVQETYRTALVRAPPEKRKRLGAWLRRVLRNHIRKLSRSAIRRRRHERLAHPRTPAPDAEVSLAKARMHLDLIEAVIALPAKERDVILLRYFDDLPPREIARVLELSVEAVKSRQKRGLAHLRAVLDGKYGSRENWTLLILPAVGLDPTTKGATDAGGISATAASGGLSVILGLGGALFVLFCLLAIFGAPWGSETAGSRGPRTPAMRVSEGRPAAGGLALDSGREQAPVIPPPDTVATSSPGDPVGTARVDSSSGLPAAPPGPAALRFSVVADDGSPIDSARVRLFGESGDPLYGRIDEGGNIHLFEAVPPGSWTVLGEAPRHLRHVSRIEIGAASPAAAGEREIILKPALVLPVQLLAPSGELLHEAQPRLSYLDPRHFSVIASEDETVDLWPTARGVCRRGRFSRYVRTSVTGTHCGKLEIEREGGMFLSLIFRHVVLERRWFDEVPRDEVRFTVVPGHVEELLGEIAVRVIDGETLTPLECTVATRTVDTTLGSGAGRRPDPDGLCVFERHVPGFVIVEITPATRTPTTPPWRLCRLLYLPLGQRLGPLEIPVWKPLTVGAVFADQNGRTVRAQVRRVNLDAGYPRPLDLGDETAWIAPDGRYEILIPERGSRILIVATAIGKTSLAASPQLLDTSYPPRELRFEFLPGAKLSVLFAQDHLNVHFAEVRNAGDLPVWAGDVMGRGEVAFSLVAGEDYVLSAWERRRNGVLEMVDERHLRLEGEGLRVEIR